MKYLLSVSLLLCGLTQAAEPQWKVQYFYDKLHETLEIRDLAFPTPANGIGIGAIFDETGAKKPRFTAVLTTDGGETWSLQPLHDDPRSLFFLNKSAGWMVGDEAIWFSDDAGQNWRKIGEQKKPERKEGKTPPGGLITRAWFVDEQHGFAVGYQKSAFQSADGGKTWTPIAEAEKPSLNPAYTEYSQIAFAGPTGIVMGGATPTHRDDPHLPSWMEPERAVRRQPTPNVGLVLETHDTGSNWRVSTVPVYGSPVALRLMADAGLAAFSFSEAFEYPTEVYRLDLKTGSSVRTFREENRRVTDVALFPGPQAFLAAVEPPGKLNIAPIPGKVRILTSSNLNDWSEMKVDYKANARAIVLAGPDADHQWAATDTGMILHLVK